MRDFSLRLPYLIYLSIGSILVGVLVAPAFYEMPAAEDAAAEMRQHAMMHGDLEVPSAGAPEVEIVVTEDPMDGWNLRVETENFVFTPETVNAENVPNTGHAHLYVNDVKLARLYGPDFHIPELPEGEHTITVNLSSNDHSYYTIGGARIEARATIIQEATGPNSG